MNVKLPIPTQLDGRIPQMREWSREAKAYLTKQNVQIEDYMDESAKSVEAIDIRNIQDVYVTEDVQYKNTRYQIVPTEDETEEYEEHNELMIATRKLHVSAVECGQTLHSAIPQVTNITRSMRCTTESAITSTTSTLKTTMQSVGSTSNHHPKNLTILGGTLDGAKTMEGEEGKDKGKGKGKEKGKGKGNQKGGKSTGKHKGGRGNAPPPKNATYVEIQGIRST
eukprot:3388038-Amphidinium_carterae.1